MLEPFGPELTPRDYRVLLKPKKERYMAVVKTSQGVTVSKPFWMSKKVILTGIAFGVAMYQAYSGNWDGLTPEQVAAQIAKTAAIIGPLMTAVMSIAKVDAQTQGASLVADGLKTLTELAKEEGKSGSGDSSARPS